MSAVRVGPIPFSAALAPLVLADLKTQTRRGLNIPAGWTPRDLGTITSKHPKQGKFGLFISREIHPGSGKFELDLIPCPYGKPGDRLYVKEDYYQRGHWESVEGVKTKGGRQKWRFVPELETVLFEEPQISGGIVWKSMDKAAPFKSHWYKRIGRFMPRKYSRTLLEITDVRVERLNGISERDAVAEGLYHEHHVWRDPEYPLPDIAYRATSTSRYRFSCPIQAFEDLWESINGAGTFDDRWVWVICFKRVQP